MDLKDLRYAIAVAEEGGFTRAAARLHLAQQALSKQIGDLERELEVQLFVRLPRGARLTPAGTAFIEGARTTLAQSERAMARARSADRRESQGFRLGLMPDPSLMEAVVQPLQCFRRRHPTVQIDVSEMAPVALLTAIREGTVDAAVVYSPPDDSGAIAGECVWERPMGAVLPARHPLADRDVVRLRDLADLPLITFPRDTNPTAFDALSQALGARGLRPRFAEFRAWGPPGLIGPFVADGNAWTLAVDGSWPLYERIPGVVFRCLADPPIMEQRWILWLDENPSPSVAHFAAAWRAMHGLD